MFERLKRLYDEGLLSEAAIRNALIKGWLTEKQANEILNPPEKQNN